MSSQTSTLPTPSLTEEEIAEYLRSHPDFFESREGLLEQLRLPHHVSGAVSLVERQIRVLRTKNTKLETQLMSLVKAAKANETLSSRMHQLALALISAENLDDVLSIAENLLTQAFNADCAMVKLLDNSAELSSYPAVDREESTSLFADAYESNRAVCGTLTPRQKEYLFGDSASNAKSSVFVPLSNKHAIGFLVLGSRDANRFHAGMGTLFLGYLGELVTHAIVAHQATDASES